MACLVALKDKDFDPSGWVIVFILDWSASSQSISKEMGTILQSLAINPYWCSIALYVANWYSAPLFFVEWTKLSLSRWILLSIPHESLSPKFFLETLKSNKCIPPDGSIAIKSIRPLIES